MGRMLYVEVNRNGSQTEFTASKDVLSKAAQETSFFPIGNTKPLINGVMPDSPAEKAGLESGDVFLKIDSANTNSTQEVIAIISSNSNVELDLKLLRDEDTVLASVTPDENGLIGISIGDAYIGEVEVKDYGFGESLVKSVTNIGGYTALTFKMLGSVIKGDVAFESSFGGPVKIAKFASQSADAGIIPFLLFLAMLSLSLAIINILPFPVLRWRTLCNYFN